MLRRMTRRLSIAGTLLGFAAMIGCDSFSPPPPPKRSTSIAGETSTSVLKRPNELTLILPDAADSSTESSIRREAGVLHFALQVLRPKAGDPLSKQTELIRRAAERGASILLVVPDGSKETADALAGIDRSKTPVFLIGRELPNPPSGPPFKTVNFIGFGGPSKKIVDAVAEDAKAAGFPADAPVILVQSETPDEWSKPRREAMVEALKAAKMPIAATVSLPDENSDVATKRLKDAIHAEPKACAIVSDIDQGLMLASTIRADLKPPRNYVVGGYVADSSHFSMAVTGQAAIVVNRQADLVARRAVQAAVDVFEGRTVPDRIEVDLPTRRSPAPRGSVRAVR